MEKERIKALKRQIISKSKHVITVSGEKIYVQQDAKNLISIGHETKCIICSELFLFLEKKVKEFAVLHVKNLLKYDGEEKYYYADKIAIEKTLKKYPKEKMYWMFVHKVFFSEKISQLNVNRLERIIELLKLKKNKVAMGYLKEYKSKYEFSLKFNKDFGDVGNLNLPDVDMTPETDKLSKSDLKKLNNKKWKAVKLKTK